MTDLRIGGLQRFSGCDWPGMLAATVFCQGCPWSCPYCYNQSLRPARGDAAIAWTDVVAFLKTRRGLLDAVVFSGGEPLAQAALPEAMTEARALGFRIGLHTGGFAPERFARIVPLTDWIGFDIKAPFAIYEGITGAPGSGAAARESLCLLLASGVAYELRTTVDPALLNEAALSEMAGALSALGAKNWVLQKNRNGNAATSPAANHLDALILSLGEHIPGMALR